MTEAPALWPFQTGQRPATVSSANGNHSCPFCQLLFLRPFPFNKFQGTLRKQEKRGAGGALPQNPGGIRKVEELKTLSLLTQTTAAGLLMVRTHSLTLHTLSPQLQDTGLDPSLLTLHTRKQKPGEVKWPLSKSQLRVWALCPLAVPIPVTLQPALFSQDSVKLIWIYLSLYTVISRRPASPFPHTPTPHLGRDRGMVNKKPKNTA